MTLLPIPKSFILSAGSTVICCYALWLSLTKQEAKNKSKPARVKTELWENRTAWYKSKHLPAINGFEKNNLSQQKLVFSRIILFTFQGTCNVRTLFT